jgi:very-short-patch-repair endonuclease
MTRIRTSNAVILQARKLAQTITESKADRANKDRVVLWCRASRLPEPVMEYRFHAVRLWRFDYAFVATKLALEIEGGAFLVGRHTRGRGFTNDLEKYAEAAILGWTVLRATPEQIQNGTAFDWLTRIFKGRT